MNLKKCIINGCKKRDIVTLLLAQDDIDINHADKKGRTSLFVAAKYGNNRYCDLIISARRH